MPVRKATVRSAQIKPVPVILLSTNGQSYTATPADHGKTIVAGGTDQTIVLPAAGVVKDGFWVRIQVSTASAVTGLTIDAPTGVTIDFTGKTAGDNLVNSAATDAKGDGVTLVHRSNTYYPHCLRGTWA